jgi:AraC-like DNA-binding protein
MLDPRIRIFLSIIEEQRGDCRVLLRNIIELLGLSQTRFRRLFQSNVGKTLGECLRESRMARAAQLLRQSNLPIREIARQCGYDDVSNFYRDFRMVYEMTPRGFRVRQLGLLCESKKPPRSAPERLWHTSGRNYTPPIFASKPARSANSVPRAHFPEQINLE